MIAPLPDIERAKRSYRKVKIWWVCFGGAILWLVLAYVISEYELLPSVSHLIFTGAFFAVLASYVGCFTSISTLAEDLGDSSPIYTVLPWVLGPLGLILAYYRVKSTASEHGIDK